MEQAHKKRPPRATANNPPVLPDMGKLLYKSGKFDNFSFSFLRLSSFYTLKSLSSSKYYTQCFEDRIKIQKQIQ